MYQIGADWAVLTRIAELQERLGNSDEAINALKKYYAEEMNTGKISFTSLNLDKKEGRKTADALKISGQTLLIVNGETKVDLTSQGFMQARSNPEKLHAIIKTNKNTPPRCAKSQPPRRRPKSRYHHACQCVC